MLGKIKQLILLYIFMSFSLPDLPYAYDALEPHLDARTLEIHHTKHHQKYTDKLNEAVTAYPDLSSRTIEDILTHLDAIPDEIRAAVRNHGGGYANHNFFWKIMAPASGGEPTGALADALTATFGSFTDFQTKFNDVAAGQFGSGWGWLVMDSDRNLKIMSTSNQDSPLSSGLTPLLAVDVWEHSYYLHYQNRRPDYITAWWNVVNWEAVSQIFTA